MAVVLGSIWTLQFKVCVCVSVSERGSMRCDASAVMLELWQFFGNVMPGVSSVI